MVTNHYTGSYFFYYFIFTILVAEIPLISNFWWLAYSTSILGRLWFQSWQLPLINWK